MDVLALDYQSGSGEACCAKFYVCHVFMGFYALAAGLFLRSWLLYRNRRADGLWCSPYGPLQATPSLHCRRQKFLHYMERVLIPLPHLIKL